MATVFDPERDGKRFDAEKDTLLTAFHRWLVGRSGDPDLTADAEVFLDWRFGYSSGEIYDYSIHDLNEFLLEWCPRKWSAQPAEWMGILTATTQFLEFLGDTHRWEGSAIGLDADRRFIEAIAPEFLEAMGDPRNFGMAKSLFMSPALAGADIDLDDLESIQRVVDRFNALPFEDRKALTDPGLGQRMSLPPRKQLPDVVSPSPASVRASSERSALLIQVRQLVEFLGEKGRPLTQKGNVKLADAKALVELLGTGDSVDEWIGDRQFKTSSVRELPQLSYVVDIARAAGAVRPVKNTMLRVKAWAKRDGLGQAESVVAAVLQIGILSSRARFNEWFEALAEFLDDGISYWLAPNFGLGHPIDLDELVETTVHAATMMFGADRPMIYADDDQFSRLIRGDLERIIRTLVAAGVVEASGDLFNLTPFGRHVMVGRLRQAGYEFDVIAPLDTATARELLDALRRIGDGQIEAIWTDWQPAMTDADKAELLVAALTGPTTAIDRLHVFNLLGRISGAAEPCVRTLIGGPLAGHASMWLSTHGFDDAPPPTIEGLAPLVDMLWLALRDLDADGLATMFDRAVPVGTQLEVVTGIWRLEIAELGPVLDALGRAHPRKEIAKAARKSLMQHRSKMANRRHQ